MFNYVVSREYILDRHFTDSCFPLANNGKVKNEPMQSCNIVENRELTREWREKDRA